MKYSQYHMNQTAYNNLKRKSFRTISMTILVGVLAFITLITVILSMSLGTGMENLKNRFGADIIVVPEGYEAGMEEILIKGEPCYFYLQRSIVAQIREMDGVETVAEQIYLTSSGESCCDFPVQIMGFDLKNDFTIRPWIKQQYQSEIGKDELIVGSEVTVSSDNTITFYGKEYKVVARLDESGTGLDQAVYADWDTITDIYDTATQKGFRFLLDGEDGNLSTKASSILIKVMDGYDDEKLVEKIQTSFDDIQVLQAQSIYSGIKDKIGYLSVTAYIFIGLLSVLLLIILVILFTIVMNERKRECGIYRMLGASRIWISKLLFQEAFLISFCGAICGVTVAVFGIVLFGRYIQTLIDLPLCMPNTYEFAGVVLFILIFSSFLGPICSYFTIKKNSKVEMFCMYRGEE